MKHQNYKYYIIAVLVGVVLFSGLTVRASEENTNPDDTTSPHSDTPTTTVSIDDIQPIFPTTTDSVITPDNSVSSTMDVTDTATSTSSTTSTTDVTTSTTATTEISTTTEEEIATSTDPAPITSGGSSAVVTTTTITPQLVAAGDLSTSLNKTIAFLKTQQDETGKIVDGNITDWSIMSFGAAGIYADDVKLNGSSLLDYEKNYNLNDPSDLNSCASYPRHILALLAAGVSATDDTIEGLRERITVDCYQNDRYGLDGINDDVFALLALMAINSSPTEPVIVTITNTIIRDQTADGAFTWNGWPGADITGAAINALLYASTRGVTVNPEVITKAKQYLHTTQLPDGGWGYGTSDILTTSWVLMGINALGETQTDWSNSVGLNPWHVIVNQQQPDGSYQPSWAPGTVDWFGVKHVALALANKSWPIILPTKVVKFVTGSSVTYGHSSGGIRVENVIPTPTTTITTTTVLEITTTTLETTTTLDMPTTTPAVLSEKIYINENQEEISKTAVPSTTSKKMTKKVVTVTPLAPTVTTTTTQPPTVSTTSEQPRYTLAQKIGLKINTFLRLLKKLI